MGKTMGKQDKTIYDKKNDTGTLTLVSYNRSNGLVVGEFIQFPSHHKNHKKRLANTKALIQGGV
jgi:hypothetical protein